MSDANDNLACISAMRVLRDAGVKTGAQYEELLAATGFLLIVDDDDE